MQRITRCAGKAALACAVVLAALVDTGCVKRDLEDYPGEGYVTVNVDWAGSGAPSANHTTRLLFYGEDGKLFREVNNVGTKYQAVFPKGEYRVVAYNEDMGNTDWRNSDYISTAETFAVGREYEFAYHPEGVNCLEVPKEVYVTNNFHQSDKLVVSDISNPEVSLTPTDRLHHLTLRFHVSVAGNETVESIGGAIGGVSGSWFAGTASQEKVFHFAHEFHAVQETPDESEGEEDATRAATADWEANVNMFGFQTTEESEWVHPLYMSLQVKDGPLLTAAYDLTPTVYSILNEQGGELPNKFAIDVEINVAGTGFTANVIPWDDSGTGGGSPRPQNK